MRSFITGAILFGVSLSLTACATKPNYHLLDAGARQHIKTVDGVLIAKQKRIGADISQNSTLSDLSLLLSASPIIPMLVDVGVTSVRTIETNKMAKPMREALEDHDYAWEFRKQVKQSLERTTLNDLAKLDKFTIIREEYPGFRGSFIEASDADAVLIVDMKYAFTPSFDKLYVASAAMLFPNTEELKQFQERPDKDSIIELSDNLYRNQFMASISVTDPSSKKAENAAFWAKIPKENLIDILERIGLNLADALANDISLDDIDSDLNLIPDGYELNTEFSNLNTLSKNRLSNSDTELSPEDSSVLTDENGS